MTRHLHLDVVGGISGDMFLSAMLSAFPEFETTLRRDLSDAGLDPYVSLECSEIRKSGFAAKQVNFHITNKAPSTKHWADIKSFITNSALCDPVKEAAIGIFTELAEAEAASHGIDISRVHFHEVADWDSLADIIGAASLIVQARAASWSCSSLPIGSGRVKTQHGIIPVPAPATAYLLEGFSCFDDGITGERITPTGAAILRFLSPEKSKRSGMLGKVGTGAGQKEFSGVANILRVLEIKTSTGDEFSSPDQVIEIEFEIDDMTPEEIATSLHHIREHQGAIDARLTQGLGKKSRPNYTFHILAKPDLADDVIALCFQETTTIGLRLNAIERRILRRLSESSEGNPVKTVQRPDGPSHKVESDYLQSTQGLEARRRKASEQIRRGENDLPGK